MYNKIVNITLKIAVAAISIIAIGGCSLSAGCGSTVLSESKSPNGLLKAVIFNYDCGATTGFSSHISILPNAITSPRDAGNIFVADGSGASAVQIKWLSSNRLLISYDKRARTFNRKKQFESVAISYKTF